MVAVSATAPPHDVLAYARRGDIAVASIAGSVTMSASASAVTVAQALREHTSAAANATSGHGGGGAASVKALQHARSEWYSEYYIEVICAFLGLLVVRNIALKISRAYARRQRQKAGGAVDEKGLRHATYTPSTAVRAIHAVDRAALMPVPFLPSDWSYLRVALIVIDLAICLVVSLVNVFYGTSTAKMFADRCGRIATADLPLLFLFVGRNNILTSLTGLSYQSLRFWHMYLGGHSTVFAIIHTFAYIGQYYTNHTTAKLRRAYGQLYFKMGIVAIVFMVTLSITGLGFIRRRAYQAFLALHVAGAAIILAGCWYHRPSMQNWVLATVGLWVFERLWRFSSVFMSFVNMRLFLRAPIICAKASIVDGAIKLRVPCKGESWGPGQHFYISFWGRDLLRRPHLYGQTHPFCAANVPVVGADQQEMRFVLRIHKGITSELEQHIRRKLATKGGDEVELMVALEGPFDMAEPAEEYESVLCLAGGSGITHPSSILADVCQKAVQGKAATTSVRLVWAIHHAEQAAWVEETLEEARAWAVQADIAFSVDLYITRPGSGTLPVITSSGSTSSSSEPSSPVDDQKKLDDLSTDALDFAARCNRFDGRPDVALEVAKAVRESTGRTLVATCGPVQLAEDVRRAVKEYTPAQLGYEIAKFDW